MKKSGVTWGVPVAPGSQLEVVDAAGGGAAGDAAGEASPGEASNAGAKGSPPPMSPGEVLKVVGVSALAMGGLAGLAYLVHRSEQRELQVFEQDRRERMAAFERETLARRKLERFIEDTVEAAAARHLGELRGRKSAAGEASRAESAASAWAQQRRELQQRADAQLAEYDAKMQEFKDQMMALMRPPAPAPSSGAVPGGVADRLRKLYDDD